MSGLSLKCVLNRRSIGRSEFGGSRPRASSVPACRMGGAQRYPSTTARDNDGFRCALPILRSVRFLPATSSRARAAQSSTVAALRQSSPFRSGPVVLRFANRPRPFLFSSQFAFHWRCRCPSRAKSTATEGLRICWSIRVGSVQKNGGHRCWHKACIG